MNGNVFGNKTSHSRQAFRAHIRPFPFSSGQPIEILDIEILGLIFLWDNLN